MPDIEWVEPPLPGGNGSHFYFTEEVRRQLRQRPGVWARVATGRTASNSALSRRHPEFEFTTRSKVKGDERTFDVYARYVGPGVAA